MVVVVAECSELCSHFLDVNIIIIFTAILWIMTHAWLEYLLSEFADLLTSEPASHRSLASDDNDEFIECVVPSIEGLAIGKVSPGRKFMVFVAVSTTAARLSHCVDVRMKMWKCF